MSRIHAEVRSPPFVHGFIVTPPSSSSPIPYQPCSLPVRRSTFVWSDVMRFSPYGLALSPALSTTRIVWTNAISSALTAASLGVNSTSTR